MSPVSRLSLLVGLALGLMTAGCMDQYHPVWFWDKLDKERETAARQLPQLKEDGTLPDTGSGQVANLSPEDKTYNNFCATCHAVEGNGKGPAGAGLQPHPRDFTDKAWQKSVSDEHIEKVIKEGGAAVGLSANMAPWGNVISADMIKKLVVKVRSFNK